MMHWVTHTNAHTNQCTLPLWSIHVSMDYSHSPQITDAGPVQAIIFLPQMSTKNKCLLTHKQLFSPANHSDCHRQTPFVYENGMSVIFPPAHTDTHTQIHTLPSPPLQECHRSVKLLNS